MAKYKRLTGWRRMLAASTMGSTCFALGACNFGEFESTSTVTLDGREVVQFLVRSAILTPIQDAIDTGVDALFDRLEDDDNGDDD